MYHVVYHESVQKDLQKINKADKSKIKKAIEKKLVKDPLLFGEPLRSNLAGYRKLRVGNYRVVYSILEDKKTLVIIIAHRRNVYEIVKKRI